MAVQLSVSPSLTHNDYILNKGVYIFIYKYYCLLSLLDIQQLYKMKMVTWVEILNEAFYISLCADALWEKH